MNDIFNAEAKNNDEIFLRPQKLQEYIGQEDIKGNLEVFIKAALKRTEVLDHVLLYGPPGLGKTTLAHIIANEMGVDIRVTNGPSLEKPGDLATILTTLNPGDILFIDEIHRMPKIVEEVLYSAMEDFKIDIVVGRETSTKTINIDLVPFTLIGATTKPGDLTQPLRDRFGIDCRLEYYKESEIEQIIYRTSRVYETTIDELGAKSLAKASRLTPRIANRLFKRIRDFAEVLNDGEINNEIVVDSLNRLKVSANGLDKIDIKILNSLVTMFDGGPVGIDSLARSIGEDRDNVEEVYEPYLIQQGYIARTQRGRIATTKTYNLLDINETS